MVRNSNLFALSFLCVATLASALTPAVSATLGQTPRNGKDGWSCSITRDSDWGGVMTKCTRDAKVEKTCYTEIKVDASLGCDTTDSKSADFSLACSHEDAGVEKIPYDCSTNTSEEFCEVTRTVSQGEMSDSEHTTRYTCAEWYRLVEYWEDERKYGGGSD